MRKFIWDIIKLLHLGSLILCIHPKSALNHVGWFRSFHKNQVADRDGNPIPWWTYSFIDFLNDRLTNNMRVLEFGCGASTVYLSSRVKEIISFENFRDWAIKIRNKVTENSKIIEVADINDFASYEDEIKDKFDILIVDNLGNRMQCAINNLKHLNERGIVIWDNTDGPDWVLIKSFMMDNGFKDISFTGMVAQELAYSKTTLFYKSNNCFNI